MNEVVCIFLYYILTAGYQSEIHSLSLVRTEILQFGVWQYVLALTRNCGQCSKRDVEVIPRCLQF